MLRGKDNKTNKTKKGEIKIKTIELSWSDLVELYDDDNMTFEEYVCDELGIDLMSWDELNAMYEDKTFIVRPRHDYIRWAHKVDSDFRISVKED